MAASEGSSIDASDSAADERNDVHTDEPASLEPRRRGPRVLCRAILWCLLLDASDSAANERNDVHTDEPTGLPEPRRRRPLS